ncbi:hypothetical protein C8J57DRAFT_1714073 [Mycena rebaudengoi]|nr:hypothetical protein C8J57DRAFT_1714073 [Mycena rebaudengoi]
MSLFVISALFLVAICVQASSILPQASIITISTGLGLYPESLAGEDFCPFGRLVCGTADDTVLISNDTVKTPFFKNPKLAEKTRWYVYLNSNPITGEELYTFYCDPTLTASKVLILPQSATAGSHASAITQSRSNTFNTAKNTILQFNVAYVKGARQAVYGSLNRFYSISTNSAGDPLYLTAQLNGSVILSPLTSPITKGQLYIMTFDPLPAGATPQDSQKLEQAVDAEEVVAKNEVESAGGDTSVPTAAEESGSTESGDGAAAAAGGNSGTIDGTTETHWQ